MSFDLLSTVTYGGCSAKLSASKLAIALKDIPKVKHERLLVDIETHDDAGVYKLNDTCALVQTLDFFPPICSDPHTFGRIAAANALSDVYAMGGEPLTAMNIVGFPSEQIPLSVLAEILSGGQEMVSEAGVLLVGGHTIDDYPPKYGLSVTGTVHPDKVITNAGACAGDLLILTKPLGIGIAIAGKRLEVIEEHFYSAALNSMQQLNRRGAELMQHYHVRCATDITGFGLVGHAVKLATASKVTITINSAAVPLLGGVYDLAEMGCLPGACFRNQEFTESSIKLSKGVDYNRKMLLMDAQTSGGLLMAVPKTSNPEMLLRELQQSEYPHAAIIGNVLPAQDFPLSIT